MDDEARQRADRRPFARNEGCVWIIGGAFLLVLVAGLSVRHWLVRNPRRQWTPAPVWQGTGFARGASGRSYPLFLKIRFERKHEGSGPADGKTNLIGTAEICDPRLGPIDLEVSGSLGAWYVENGKEVTLYLRTERSAYPRLFFLLYGSWQGQELLLEDRGTMENFFKMAERLKNSRFSPAARRDTVIVLHYGERAEFDRACPALPDTPGD
ncbi:MAG TPA: hypothetical protein VGH83_03880 [Candidatus Acidoferrum sp.]|jgi:hypothetical protein